MYLTPIILYFLPNIPPTVSLIGYDHPMMNLMNETVLVPSLGISSSAVGLGLPEGKVYVYATTCRECGEWEVIGSYADDMCEFCT